MRHLAKLSILLLLLALVIPGTAQAAQELIPVGEVIGLQLQDDHVSICAFDDTLGSCAKKCGLKVGDVITEVNGIPIHTSEDIRTALAAAGGSAKITVCRGSRKIQVTLIPTATDGGPKLGVYLRQGIAGIGTVTWYDPEQKTFGALGHGVNEPSGCLLRMTAGQGYEAQVLSVLPGKRGRPGQLKGSCGSEVPCAQLCRNTPQGVFGTAHRGWSGQPLPVAQPDQLHTGCATILSTVCADGPEEYSVEIVKLYPCDRSDGRNLLLKVTDSRLLGCTGGIVQGMSGSPILQDGRIVGAVTHVLVNDPTMGYGIFIGNMLEAAQQ